MSVALDQAEALLAGQIEARTHSVRAAAWLTRSALEELIEDLVRARGLDPGRASVRTRLGCIESLYHDSAPQVASGAQYAWDALSRACHQHAFELSPTHREIVTLTALVRSLEQAMEPASA